MNFEASLGVKIIASESLVGREAHISTQNTLHARKAPRDHPHITDRLDRDQRHGWPSIVNGYTKPSLKRQDRISIASLAFGLVALLRVTLCLRSYFIEDRGADRALTDGLHELSTRIEQFKRQGELKEAQKDTSPSSTMNASSTKTTRSSSCGCQKGNCLCGRRIRAKDLWCRVISHSAAHWRYRAVPITKV
ncbi:hypothetical protein K470DRAFT_22329 [Piedraia hortae CBS 480.64]|uniref:Uncharacterized protein n=1 Tax=Piedraia hortae CBS 480.64 TaxID=1314780 RepID=A0A6A7C5T3_9PEZI|nr:hypothetical protein K470DRAFT_22329 [Piedraia hortae CBS 480.64]